MLSLHPSTGNTFPAAGSFIYILIYSQGSKIWHSLVRAVRTNVTYFCESITNSFHEALESA